MKSWEIWSYHPADFPEPHPAVIVSHPDRVARKPAFSILMCSSHRAGRTANWNEVILDQADGLDWPTLCFCDLIYAVSKTELKTQRGQVTSERRREIIRTINIANGWV